MTGYRRRAAGWLMRAATRLFPGDLAPWSRAMANEFAMIADDRAALSFAVGCLHAAATLALPTWSSQAMNLLARPRSVGLVCAAAAVLLGLAYMAIAGAPQRYLLTNLAALVLGSTLWLGLGRSAAARLAGNGGVTLALSLPLLATALLGINVDGVSRWIPVGPLNVQVSLVLLPPLIVLYARSRDAIGTVGIAIAALALALQPDRAMAGVLAAGLAAVVLAKPARLPALGLLAALLGFGATLILPDASQASPFVDRILYTAFSVHAFAGVAVVAGCVILAAPALVGFRRAAEERPAVLAFGACWVAVVAAAALGNYPTPLVGYGGSAVLGYLLSVTFLPDRASAAVSGGAKAASPLDHPPAGGDRIQLRIA